jgi:hypothetical protein
MSRIKTTTVTILIALLVGLHSTARAQQNIALRSGFDEGTSLPLLPGVADTNITQINNPTAGAALSASPFVAADFAAARTGGTAFSIQAHPSWIQPALFADPQARWINWTPSLTPRSALYAMPFNVTVTNIVSASLTLDYACDDAMGDTQPLLANPPGVFFGIGTGAGSATSPIIQGGPFNVTTTATRNITGQIATGLNYLYVYQRDIGAGASGSIFSARISVIPEPATVGALAAATCVLLMRRPRRN